ncbi:MAG: hypothetical protein JSS99_12325 [Actinobacteria bacterium]|nr:hypothetical protein [Actinomycetota bacterium]
MSRPEPDDPLLATAARLTAELRERCAAPDLGDDRVEELLIDGYASALALEGARRRMRERALELSSRELAIAAQERELRTLLRTLRARRGSPRLVSDDEPAPQRLH